ARHQREPRVRRGLPGVPRRRMTLRKALDWILSIAAAIVFVLVFEAECAKPSEGCVGSFNDRVIAARIVYDFESPRRGQIVVFKAPPAASVCGPRDGGTTFVKRLIGLPGDRVVERDGTIFVNGTRLDE